ncbi:MAG: ABC transporter substrate-binding protein [Spirochaetes bacterium]|nr:MAG: ABC transporter substrate-binding protein [Spirochaetota bacterium]
MFILCVAVGTAFAGCKKGSGDTVKIGAIFAVTGGASYLGSPEARTAQMLVDEINDKGGINGKQVELVIKDSEGNPEKAISFAKQLIEEEKVFAIIGPSTSGETMKIKSLCEESKMLLISCAAAEIIVNPVAKYVFKTPQKDSHVARMIFETMKKKGIAKIGIISDNTGFGAAGKEQLEKIAPEYGVAVLISEVYNMKATDLTGVLAKLKGQNVQAVINWSIVPAQAIVAKNMKQIKFEVPLFQSHGFGNLKYAEEAGKAGDGIIFPVGRLLVADQLPDTNKQKVLLQKFKKDYESRFKEDVSAFGGYAYDALVLLFEGMKKAGVNDREKVRDAIEQLRDIPGTSGVFSLSPQDHNGLGMNSLVILTVKDGKFVPYEKLD